MVFRIIDKIPHDQEIVYIPHIVDRIQFISQDVPKFIPPGFPYRRFQSFKTKLIQIFPRSLSVRHFIFRQLRDSNSISTLHRSAIFCVFSNACSAYGKNAPPSVPAISHNTVRPHNAYGSRRQASFRSGCRAGYRGFSSSHMYNAHHSSPPVQCPALPDICISF